MAADSETTESRWVKSNSANSPEINPLIHGQMVFHKGGMTFNKGKIVFSTHSAGKTGYL